MVGNTKTKTKADQERFDAIAEIGCLACAVMGWIAQCQVHHLLESTSRYEDEHRHTIGLCPWHHEGKVPRQCCGSSVLDATSHHGPSLAHTSREFHRRYGADQQLLIIQDAMIRIVERARKRGEYLPPREMVELIRQIWREVVKGHSMVSA